MALSCAADLLGCTKLFVRWLHGSCQPAPPQKVGSEEKAIFTYFREISSNSEVSMLMYQIVQTLKVSRTDLVFSLSISIVFSLSTLLELIFLLIGLKQQLSKIQDCSLTTTHSARNLGFIFDEHVTFSDQITALSKSCYYHIRELRRIRPYLDFKTASTIAHLHRSF